MLPQPFTSYLLPILLLVGSNIFMTTAWYWHLRFKEVPLFRVIKLGARLRRILPGGSGQSVRQRRIFPGAAQDDAGGDHVDRVRRLLGGVSQGAADLEPGHRVCPDRGGCILRLSQPSLLGRGAPNDAFDGPRRREAAGLGHNRKRSSTISRCPIRGDPRFNPQGTAFVAQ